ncbi:MAG: excinuclease ABC subunit UvrA [Candidatus Magasanikbacteria bacterium]
MDKIIIKGARVHNLKNVNIEIPKNKLVVITGLSGSGKSSLAFDTIYAEGQRRYVESLSSYARQFMDVRDKPEVDKVEGLSPTIAIDQKVSTQNPRSTVGTVTEIYDYLRLLFARSGVQHCPDCNVPVKIYTAGEVIEAVRTLARRHAELLILSPLVRGAVIENSKELLERVEKSGLEWVRVNKKVIKINELASFVFNRQTKYFVELVAGKITDIKKQDPTKMVEIALDLSNGLAIISTNCHPERSEGSLMSRSKRDSSATSQNDSCDEQVFSTVGLCPSCGRIMPTLDIRNFSFNSPYGACPRCTGLGVTMEVNPSLVIPNPRLTLAEGAIQPWTRITGNQNGYQKLLSAVAVKHGFSVDMPATQLPPKILEIIMNGTGEEKYLVDGKYQTFSGVIPDLTDRHLKTDSDYVRKEIEQYMRQQVCPDCHGKRLRAESIAVKWGDYNIADLAAMDIEELLAVLDKRNKDKGIKNKASLSETIIRETLPRLDNLDKVGLNYLSLDRPMNTLSGGEITRVRLATQLSSGLTGVIYVLDEPSVGLHPRDNAKLISTLKYLRDLGNSVIVVEHDSEMMQAADWVIDVGPGAGVRGGEIIAQGTIAQIKKTKNSLTGQYLSGVAKIECLDLDGNCKKSASAKCGSGSGGKKPKYISIVGAKAFNLKNVSVDIPLQKLVCVTGVSGSGKSSLVIDILGKSLNKHFYRAKEEPAEHKAIKGLENIDKVIAVNQDPIGRTPRSNPATYTGVFTLIRDLFSELPEAEMRRFDAGKFSFNVKGGGRCEACAGEGYIRIPMQFLADVYMECAQCNGTRYNQEALEIHYHGKNIAQVLSMTVEEAYQFFSNIPLLADKLGVLREVGLGYVQLGQPATTLSGGEAQRIKLATELARPATGSTLYILDEPTTGLHFEDIKRLLGVLNRLVEKGNTVIIIEHNVDVIKCSDWIIDLGPGGGKHGGEIITVGTPSDVKKNKKSWTGKYL